jgi:hypothetical protein
VYGGVWVGCDGDAAGESQLGKAARQGGGKIAGAAEQALETGGVDYDCVCIQLFHAGGEFGRAAGDRRAWAMDAHEHSD